MPRSARLLLTLCLTLLVALPAFAGVDQYTSIVVFGDSLSDTGNVAILSELKYGIPVPGPFADYTLGRFTDGPDTLPAARAYFGLWIEQLAALLPAHPQIRASLAGGTNFAYSFAYTGPGTSVLTLSTTPPATVTIDNIGRQIATYLATHPKIDDHTLFVVWGGANDVLNAASPAKVSAAALNELLGIQQLINAGATDLLVANLPPLGAIPRLNASPLTATPATEASVLFNQTLAFGLDILPFLNQPRRLSLHRLDIFTLFELVLAAPATRGFSNVTAAARGLPAVDPDTFLFWDDLHPTTRGHNLIALAAWRSLTTNEQPPRPAELTR